MATLGEDGLSAGRPPNRPLARAASRPASVRSLIRFRSFGETDGL